MVEELDIADLRVYFIADYLIKSLRLRSDKWSKMIQIEDQNRIIIDFCEKPQPNLLVFHVNPAGSLVRRFIFYLNTIKRFFFFR
jgi:dynein heavy chain